MNKGLFRKILPHLIAVLLFLIIAIIYCKPALEGMVLQQHDITQWKGAIHQSELVKERTGHAPLWTNSMFGGMPTFQIGFENHNKIPSIVQSILTLGLPEPIQFFFLSRSEEHTSELQSHVNLVCRLLLEKKKKKQYI